MDSYHKTLVVEVRHSSHRVLFAAIDPIQKKLLWDKYTPAATWWSSGVLAQNGILFLQTFPEGQNPDPQGIVAIEIATQRLLWQQPDYQVLQWQPDNRLLARQMTEAHSLYHLLDAATGTILHTQPDPFRQIMPPPIENPLQFPVHYTSDDIYFQSVADFLQQTLGVTAKNALDYAETKHCIIISYYIYVDKQVENYLVVFDTHSRVPLLHEKLATQRTGIGKDTFFILDQLLIFVQEQSVLLSYEI